MLQHLAWVVSLLLIAVIAGVFIHIVSQSQLADDDRTAAASASSWRSRIFWTLTLLFVPIIGYSLTGMPYPASDTFQDAIVVDAKGYQWRWELSRTVVPVGKPIEFRVTADDVNHGFSLYDANLKLRAQTQAMPGVTNVLRYTFTAPGTYKVLCLEYCGLAHHNMTTEIQVVVE